MLRCIVILLLLLSLTLSGCASQATPSTQTPKVQQLRIINNGSYAIDDLVVRFRGVNVAFGDVPVGTTTGYKDVPNGVLRYAAYQFEVNGKVVSQDVIDWMGENPMEGNSFIYIIDFDPSRFGTNDSVRLVEVKTDN